jgi:hypothetical protein
VPVEECPPEPVEECHSEPVEECPPELVEAVLLSLSKEGSKGRGFCSTIRTLGFFYQIIINEKNLL